MASKLHSSKTKTILYWTAILVLFALFIGFLVAFLLKPTGKSEDVPTETPPISTTPPPTAEEIRLDESVRPTNYDLSIRSDHDKGVFGGTVTIDLSVTSDITELRLHCKNLEINHYDLKVLGSGTSQPIASLVIDDRLEVCVFTPKSAKIEAGNYTLSLEFAGTFKEGQITGFYRSTYLTVDNEIRSLTATKFEPTYARLAFPCFDEPRFKAEFQIAIIHPSSHIALSNEIEMSSVPIEPGWTKTAFKKTAPIATYLIAFVVCDFKYTETKTTGGMRVRVYSRPDQVEKTRYAVETAAKVLGFYENYTAIPYALNKLDLIGLPEFVSGAMENWGLVTYKETYVLYSDSDSSASDMRQIASVIAHELAHMWFGNLVTLEWWNDLWLNEGFASYIEYKGMNFVNKSWNIYDLMVTGDLHSALRADSQQSAHPVVSDVLTPNQITSIFDTFSYSKGASVLYVIENIIGGDIFRECARRYLADNKFGSVNTPIIIGYLKDAIFEATGIDGSLFLDKYLYSTSYPILTVERSGSKKKRTLNAKTSSLTITQSAFNADVSSLLEEPWIVQVPYFSSNNRSGKFVLSKVTQTVNLAYELMQEEWFKLNRDSSGYYVVNYSKNDWKLIIAQLKEKVSSISIKDRANILFDANQLSEKALLDYETLFNLIDYLRHETEYLPWSVGNSILNSIQSKMTAIGSSSIVQLKAYIRELINSVYESSVDFSANPATLPYDKIALRNVLIALACRTDYQDCLDNCAALFRKWIDKDVPIDPNIRSYVYRYGLQTSNVDDDWRRIWDMYVAEKDALEKSKLMSALTSTRSTTMLLTLISYSANQSVINNENFFSVQQNIAANSDIGRGLVWEYIKNNWDVLVNRFGLNDRRLGNYVKSVTSGFGTNTRLIEMQEFFDRYPDAGAGAAARISALESVNKNIKWDKENGDAVRKVMNDRDQFMKPWLNWRLDEMVRPVHYAVNLTIDIDQEVFSGSVAIEIDVQRAISHLILHVKDLEIITSKVYTNKDRTTVSATKSLPFEHKSNQFWIIPMERIILPGKYIAELTFSANLTSSLSGLYLSRYVNSKNEMVKLATTQFEAGYARKAFPCFDEPGFKATFTISITHASKYSAISNMPVDYIQANDKDLQTTVFQRSVKMSTYIVAMVVSDFGHKSSPVMPNFSVYTFNPTDNLAKVDFALDVGVKYFNYYANDYFKIPYPLPKTDMIAIPDFLMGAMENWGLITYRDTYLLYDPAETTSASKMTIATIIAHELAHFWYGNLVTIQFWDDIWLNEGFAQFMMYKATAAVEPTWNYLDYFPIKELNRVFDLDSSLSTHPILTKVKDENDMQAVFDPVTYAKGSSIIRMLENTIGEENFRIAVSNYLNKYAYKNAITNDLWAEFSKVMTGVDRLNVADMMDTWIRKDGFPVVTIISTDDTTFQLKQERFLKDYSYSNSSYTWYIPLTYRVIDTKNADLDNPVGRIGFNTATKNATIAEYKSGDLVKLNVDQTGVFIVNYPTAQWKNFINALNDNSSIAWKKLSALDRNNLLNDAFYLARSGRLSYDYALQLTQFLRFERSFTVWQTASDMLRYLRIFAITQDGGIAFNQWLHSLVTPLYDELGWVAEPEDDLNRRQLRVLILDLACLADHSDCLDMANQLFKEYQQQVSGGKDRNRRSANSLDPDTFNVFLFHTMRTVTDNASDKDKFNFLLEQYQAAPSTNEKLRFLRALTAVRGPALLNQLVEKSLDLSFLRSQDYFTFLYYIGSNSIGRDIAWKSYRDNFPTIQTRFGLDDSNLGRAIYRFATYFNTQDRRQEVMDFYANYPRAGASELYRQQALELIDANVKWSTNYFYTVIEYLTKKCDSTICPWNVYRLTDAVTPSALHIDIQVNTDSYLYNGTIRADVKVTQPIKYLILHAAKILKTSKPSVQRSFGSESKNRSTTTRIDAEFAIGEGFRYEPLEFYVIPVKDLSLGDYSVQVYFEGSTLLGGQVGLYRGWYENGNATVNIASTQFQSTHARKVFPCFDEPHFKQVIHMNVTHRNSMITTLSNMPIAETFAHPTLDGWSVTRYEPSVKMVTYLIAILVSDFHCTYAAIEGLGSADSLNISTCASPIHPLSKHQYSLDVTPAIIGYYEKTLKQKYQISKLDQIALPQFSAGAMENWGLIKYRERMLLWQPEDETSSEQRSVVAVIAHEIAHMWFGNLLTCDFWGSLWLNEAFASYMEYGAVAAAHPEWHYFDTLAYYDQFSALLSDSSETSQSIVRNVTKPSLMSYSSAIVYNKGSSVLHMFNATIGKDNFVNSLQAYLEKYKYTSVVSSQLFEEFGKNWKYQQNITEFLHSWTHQPGFPYLNVSRDAKDGTFSYTQERFLQTGAKPKKDYQYVIPFSYYKMDAKTRKLQSSEIEFLTEKTGKLPAKMNDFVKINPGFDFFYLVNYPDAEWARIAEKLVANSNDFVNSLLVNDRADLLISSFLLARAKLTSYMTPFKLFNYLVHEKHFIPWYFYDYSVSYLAPRLDRTEYRESFLQFERRLTAPHYTGIDFWNLDSTLTNMQQQFRQSLITITCRSGNERCLDDAYTKFSAWKQSNAAAAQLPPNLRENILCYGLRRSKSDDDIDFVLQRFTKEKDSSPVKGVLLRSLSFISDSDVMKRYIDKCLNETVMTPENFVSLFIYVIQNPAHELMAWKYFDDNFSMLSRKLSNSQIDSIVTRFAINTWSSDRKQQFSRFLVTKSPGSASNRRSVLGTIDNNISWMTKHKSEVGEWFTANACGGMKPVVCPWGTLRIDKKSSYPTAYDLTIQVNVTTYVYNGTVKIAITTTEDLDFLTLNAASILSVDLVSITRNEAVVSGSIFRYKAQDYIVIRFGKTQPAGQYILEFNFKANLLDGGLSGLYLSNYTSDGQRFGIASTQFEFYDARKVFPCFDEPAFKSTFTVSIIHDAKMNATLSNMGISNSAPVSGFPDWIKTDYEPSPSMTTYLVAMLVSDFVCVHKTATNVRYGVCASRAQQFKMQYALDTASKSLQHLESITAVKYPLKKVDLLAIPDFNYGAMENWGLVTFRESALLFSDSDSTSAAKMGVATIIAHELAHFWFGNLVTCEWWDVLFLNEAFATYMEYTTVNASEPSWNYFDMFLMSDFESAISVDTSDTVHPVLRPITKTPQIDQFTSTIIYSKGATILRMTEFVMGTEKFYQSIKEYLSEKQFSNARETDLFAKFDKHFPEEKYNLNASYYLDNWIKMKGYPYINVSIENDKYKIQQKRFLLSPTGITDTIWNVPFSYYIDKQWSDSKIHFLTKQEDTLTDVSSSSGLIKFNAGHNGFYLVNYSPEMWNSWIDALTKDFSKTNLPPVDRAGLLLDAFYLARGNLISYVIPLKLARFLVNENHITPWTLAIRGLNLISKNVLFGSSYGDKFQQYAQELVIPIYNNLGWNDPADQNTVMRRLRALILDFACANKYEPCIDQSLKFFQQWKEGKLSGDSSKIPKPNLLSTVLKYGLTADGSSDNWLFVWSQYLKETSATIKSIYLNALARTSDQNLIKSLLTQALEAKVIRSQDANSVFSAIANSKKQSSVDTLWQFYKANYVRLASPGSPLRLAHLSSILNYICSNLFFTADRKIELQNFFSQYPNLGLSVSQRTSALNTIDGNINWIKNRMIEVENFLQCNDKICPFTAFRLNKEVYPERYDLDLTVDLENDRFEGSVTIATKISGAAQNLRYLTVSAASSLNITSSKVINNVNKAEIMVKRAFAYKPYEFWVLELEQPVQSTSINLKFEFNSNLATDMQGFYRSEYVDFNNRKVKLAATQFQDTYARRAFPCFDEPSFKSVFSVKLTYAKQYNATMSNNVVKSSTIYNNNMVTTVFEDTPPMVTYLLAFIVSDFYCGSSPPEQNSPLVRVCSSPPQAKYTEYALEKAPHILKNMAIKYNNPYQLGKMDIVAIPDFSAGAMENWGLLTFRETSLLWGSQISSAYDKMRVASVVAHEITHMWFGNQVTCEFWSDLWINEAFASYMEWFSVDQIEPTWNYKQLFYITDYILGLNADASSTAHPLIRVIEKPSDINYISNIIYQKGSSVLRMFEFVFSNDNFFNTLGTYLQTNKYKSIPSSVLLDSLATISVKDLNSTAFVYSWASQAGIPYINLTRLADGKSNSYTVTQERFFSNGRVPSNTQTWVIPLSYYKDYSSNSDYDMVYIDAKAVNISVTVSSPDSLPIKFNTDSQGYYIVNYPKEDWQKWIEFFKDPKKVTSSTKLTPQDYSQLLYDAFTLSSANLLPYETALEMTALLRHNEMFSVWSVGSTVIGQLWPHFRVAQRAGIGALMQRTFQSYAQELVRNIYPKYGLQIAEPTGWLDQRLRSEISAFACAYQYDICLLEALVEFKKWRSQTTTTTLSPNVLPTVLRYAIQESNDDDDWNFLWKAYVETSETKLKLDYLQGLAQTANPNLLKLLFERANNQTLVRRQDYLSLYSYAVRTQIGFTVAWDFYATNYKSIRLNRLKDSQIGSLAGYFARYLNTAQQKANFHKFFIDHPDTGISANRLNAALETIDKNIQWLKDNRQTVYDWLRVNVDGVNRSSSPKQL